MNQKKKKGFSKKLLIADYVVAAILMVAFFICVYGMRTLPSGAWSGFDRICVRHLCRIARELSKLEPKVLLRNFPSVEQIQEKVGMG